jgi:c-di-GMP-binding flagellar brake protein YcgR
VTAERRQYPRYIIPEVEFQVFTRAAEVLGKLEDISKDGLAFRFSSGPVDSPAYRTVNITATGPERFHLAEISCRQVYEVSVLTEDQSFSGTSTRRCGVQFTDLNIVQEQQLDFLLDHFGFTLCDTP